jgi:hypothetical protein
MKKTFWVILALMLFGALEALSFAGLQLIHYMRPRFFREEFVARHFASLTNDDFLRFKRCSYDPQLGWDHKPNRTWRETNHAGHIVVTSYAPDGARRDGLPAKADLIATYGDSFTASAEVNDDETWQFYLEKQLGYEVKNFGVRGYGTDQALLKLERDIAHGEISPILILGVFEENINRIVNQFRPFYLPETDGRLAFKPVFHVKEGRLILEPNPLTPEAASVSEAEETAHKLVQTDYWAKPDLQNRFPYILQIPSVLGLVWGELERRRLPYLWQDERAAELMSMIISRFVATVKAAGVTPIILFIPDVRLWGEGRRAPEYENFKDELRHRNPDLLVVDIAEHDFEEERFNIVPFAGHASAYGNEQIARILAQGLRSKGFDFAKLSSTTSRRAPVVVSFGNGHAC